MHHPACLIDWLIDYISGWPAHVCLGITMDILHIIPILLAVEVKRTGGNFIEA